jgi:hypothetical protein
MYEEKLCITHHQDKNGLLYIKTSSGKLLMSVDPFFMNDYGWPILIGMISAYNERVDLEKKLKK